MENRQDIEASQDKGMCKRYLKSMAMVFFSDYHLVSGFMAACKEDVVRLQCGVISESVDETESTQVRSSSVTTLPQDCVTHFPSHYHLKSNWSIIEY